MSPFMRSRRKMCGPSPLLAAAALAMWGVSRGHTRSHRTASCEPEESCEETAAGQNDILTVAAEAGNFNTLAAALEAADLVETLKGEGPFTVFAPTDEAFAQLPEGTVEDLLKAENKEKLSQILTYHVVSGKIMAADLIKLSATKTVNGKPIQLGLRVNDANVVEADIRASNGIIHVIDSVIMPPEEKND